jgi:crotonobetainyl-CoA:carnitine CoA-transferase CaiB-like acyl-CoA transferase
MDNQAAYYNANAILMALLRRNMSGEGTEIDVAAVEVAVTMLGPVLLDVVVNGRTTRTGAFPTGNRLEWPRAAPHGVYPTNEDDRWVAIAVFEQHQWLGLRRALGDPEWAADERLSTQEGRFAAQDDLDRRISAWTRDRDGQQVAAHLQSFGVPAGAVQNARDLRELDPQVAARDLFFELDHPVIGRADFEGTPVRFSTIRQDNWRSAPLVGEDTEYVLREILGDDESGDGCARGLST